MEHKISKGTVTIDGQIYKAFENTFTKEWYIVRGKTCFDVHVKTRIEAKSARGALMKWMESIKNSSESH